MTILSAAILLFVVMDAFGNMPLFVTVLETLPEERRKKVLLRELLIALVILIASIFLGPLLMKALHISAPSLGIAGGIILFMIAIKMVFGGTEQMFKGTLEGEPLIVPLAVPYLAGPSAVATILLLVGQEPGRWADWLLSLVIAWAATSFVLMFSMKLSAILGKKVLCAIERLMGLMLTAISIEMLINGIRTVFEH